MQVFEKIIEKLKEKVEANERFGYLTASDVTKECIDIVKEVAEEYDNKLIEDIKNGIKASNANDDYMTGLRNGMRWCLSLIDGKEPEFEDCNNGWIPADNPPTDEDMEYILCVSGRDGNITYENAVLLGPNYYEDGKWYIDGVLKDNVEVLAYMPSPAPYQTKGE